MSHAQSNPVPSQPQWQRGRWLWRFVRRYSAFAWGWEIARARDCAMLAKCHEDNCRAIRQLGHELEEVRKSEMLARTQLSRARASAERAR